MAIHDSNSGSRRSPSECEKIIIAGDDWPPDPVDLKPFLVLDAPRSLGRNDLPHDVAEFYRRHEGVGLSSSPNYPVRLCRLHEVKVVGCQDILVLKGESTIGWNEFAGVRIGVDSFGDEIDYILSAPGCSPGSIMLLGPDVAGPGGTGEYQLEPSLVVAGSLDEWLTNLRRDEWTEYGAVPGSCKSETVRQRYRALNPAIAW